MTTLLWIIVIAETAFSIFTLLTAVKVYRYSRRRCDAMCHDFNEWIRRFEKKIIKLGGNLDYRE